MKKRTRALFLKVITFFQIFSLTFQPLSLLSVFVLDPVVARAQGEAVVEEQVIAEPVVEAGIQAEPAAADDAEEIIEHEDSDEDLIDVEEDAEEESEEESEEIPPVLDEEEPSDDEASDEADLELSIPEPTLTLMPTPMPTVAIAEEVIESKEDSSLMLGDFLVGLNAEGIYSISSTSGVWTSATPYNAASGINTSEIKWGTGNPKSGLRFDNAPTQNFDAGETFLIGKLTHMNWPVSGTTASSATLKVTLNFSNPTISPNPTFSYTFAIEETTNQRPCPDWHIDGHPACDDRITFPNAYGQEVFTIGDTKYTLVIDGFQSAYPTGSPVSKFVTQESKDNTAFLVGHLSSVLVEKPAISITKKVNDDDANTPTGPIVEVGDTVDFTYIVQNTGNVKLTNIGVADDKGVAVTCLQDELEKGETMICTGSSVATEGQYKNIGTVTGTHSGGQVTASDPAHYLGVVPKGTLTIVKQTLPAGSDQEFTFTSAIAESGTFTLKDGESKVFTLDAGTYSVSENSVAGWENTKTECTDGSSISEIELSTSENVTCTFTNTKHGKISGYKYNDADNSDTTTNDRTPVSGWTIFIDQDGDGELSSGDISTTTNAVGYYEFTGLLPGNYDVYEALQAGWIVLVVGSHTVELPAGGDIKDVNFVNVKQGSITVIKNVDENGDGDVDDLGVDKKDSADWTWTLNGDEKTTGGKISPVNPGEYIIKEVNKDNYHFVSLVCTGGSDVGIVGDTATIKLKSGEDVVCTYTNARNLGTLIVKKVVVNDNGGTLKPEDFNFKIDGGDSIQFESDGENTFTKYAGSSYDIVEVEADQRGYTTTYDNCSNVVVPYGGTATCTITNNDNTASLQLVKEVVNNNGGKAKAIDWNLKADGPTTISGNGGVTSGTDFKAGTYTLSESGGPAGYSASKWSCTNNIAVNENNQITLALGQSTVCTIINDDIAPKLTLNKIVSNTNGGNKAESAWTLYAKQGAETALSGKGAAGENDVVSGGTFQAGTYTLSEEGPRGYKASAWSCTGGSLRGDQITLNIGQEAVCSITNSDLLGKLTVVKNIVNDNGGNATIGEFAIKIKDGSEITFGQGVLNGATTTYTAGLVVKSNTTFTLIEKEHSGYKAGNWICKDNNTNAELAHPVRLLEGQDVTCAITNDDIAPSLTLVKEVENNYGGDAEATDWTLKADGPTTISGDGGVVSRIDFKAGTYTLSESVGSTDYSAGPWSCTNNVAVGEGNSITLDVGQSTTCTITNSDSGLRNPLLSIIKSGSWVDANGDGYADVGETISYTFTVTNEGNEILTNVTVTDLLSGLSTISCPATTLAVGTDMTCTATYAITQADIDAGEVENIASADSDESPEDTDDDTVELPQNPALGIVKTATPSTYDEVGDVIEYSFEVTNTGNVTLIGPFTVSDDKATDESCPKTESLAPGATITCTASYEITLDDLDAESVTNVASAQGYFGETPVVSPEDTETVTSTAGKITVYKYYDVNRDGVKDWDEATLADWEMVMSSDEEEDSIKQSTADSGSTLFYLPAGDWQLSETMQEDWEQTGIYCEYAGEGDLISLPGEGYGCHGDCDGWNECGDAATCALWACNINGYANLVSYGKDYPCTQLNNCHLFNSGPGSIQWNWGNWCDVSGVTDIYCSNGNGVPQRLVGYDSRGDVYQNNAYNLTVNPGDKKICYVGNTLNSQLMIEKSNDAWPNDQEIGDEVTYTIKLMATDGPVYDVSLFDLPPNAFSYVAGSYMANSSIAGDLSLSEPNYASPGEWQLGDLAKDEIVTVSYKAIIGDEADAGIYPDAAWATGTSSQARYFEEEADLLALSDPDFKADNGEVAFLGEQGHYGEEHFVGTRVAVVTDETPSAKYKVEKIKEKEGAVLGAILPATGANFWLSLLAIISILTGTGLLLVPNRKRRQGKVLMMLLMLGLGLLMAKPVQALTSVRLAQPYNSSAELDQDAITNQDEFRIDFVILNTDGASLTAQCQQQEDGGAWTNIDTVYTAKAGGNSGYCEAKDLANSSQYAFRVLTSDGEESQSVKVGLETDRPKKPVSYEKHEISSCKYEIKFKTADDGRTSKVEVYRSDDNVSFTAKASSRIKTITIGSDEKHSFETTRPDCDKDYYYAIRAFDQYGNASDLVGDREVKTVIVEGTEAEEAGALAVTETVVLDGDVGDAGVLSEGLLGEEVAEDEKGTILGIDTESLVSFLTKVALPILVFVTIAILVYRLVIAKRNEK